MLSIGFYRKQLGVFILLGLFLTGVGFIFSRQTSSASGRPIMIPSNVTSAAVQLTLEDRGKVNIGGEEIGGVIRFAKDGDEFRYLLLDQPNSFLDYLKATIVFPRPVDRAKAQATAITINTPQDSSWKATWVNDTTLEYEAYNLGPVATLTLVVELPKGVIQPSIFQSLFGSIVGLPKILWITLAIVLPLLTLFILYLVLLPRLRFNRSGNLGNSTVTQLPETLRPATVSALIDGRVSSRAIAATLIDLAHRGYFEILSHDGSYTFHKLGKMLNDKNLSDLEPFEKALLNKIFGDSPKAAAEDVSVRIGNALFSREVAEVYLGIYESVTKQGFFIDNPSIIQGSYRLIGLIMFFVSILGFGFGTIYFSDPPTPLLFWVGMIISALIIIAIAPKMPAYTPSGFVARRKWLAFKKYLETQNSADYTAANQEQFLTYLPYAIAMGVEVPWVRRFLEAPFRLPDWYSSRNEIVRLEDFSNDLFPIVGFLSKELAAAREPTLS